MATVFCNVWPIELMAISAGNRIAGEENAHQNHECQHHIEVTKPFDASLEAQPHAGAKHRNTGCHDEKLHSKLTGMPVNLEMSAAIMGVENPNELPMPPTKAIMKSCP